MNADKYQVLSRFQEKVEGNKVRCRICPHNCVIPDGKTGICRTRINRNGTLLSLAYGNPCSVSIDPIEKKPLFHFFPGEKIFSLATAGCNFRCLNCQNWQISQSAPDEISNYDLSPRDVIRQAELSGTRLIAFTYTEPTVFYEYMYDTARTAHSRGMKTVIVSNGYINREPLLELIPYLDGANIDLKCFDIATYHRLTGGQLQPVLDTLKILRENKVWLEITNLLIPSFNDKTEQIRSMCNWLADNGFIDTPIHFSRFFPNYKLTETPPTPIETLIEAKKTAEDAGLKFVYIGNTHQPNGENTSCPHCKRMIIGRTGFSVTENHVVKGKCRFCGTTIPGVWE